MPSRTPSARPSLERLEDRCVLSAAPLAPEPKVELAWVPNDAQFSQQWSLRNTGQGGAKVDADLDADQAWNIATTSRVVTGVIDSGIDYLHPDLYLNVWLNQGEIPKDIRARLIDTDGDGLITFRDLNDKRNQGAGKITDLNGTGFIDGGDLLKTRAQGGWADGLSNDGDKWVDDLIGWNFAKNSNNPMDDTGHGTHVSGTIGAVGNNGIGVAGIAWNTQVMALKTFASGSGTVDWLVQAMDYAAAKGAKVLNGSWVLGGPSDDLKAGLDRMQQKGVVVVVAAGNYAKNLDATAYWPASYANDNIVAVAATDAYDKLASYSSWGAKAVDIAAPGNNILSTNMNKSYGNRTGTSMATPHVAGAIALVWSLRPEWTYKQAVAQVLNTAERLATLTGKVASGRLNLLAALQLPPRSVSPTSLAQLASLAPGGGGGLALAEEVAVKAPPFLVPPPEVAPPIPVAQPTPQAVADAVFSLPAWAFAASSAPTWQSAQKPSSDPPFVAPPGAWIGHADALFAAGLPFGAVPGSGGTAAEEFATADEGLMDELFSQPGAFGAAEGE
ncbi:MAG: S8 family serine peptidase [Gemmataceae bacterium]|nr:S8 family serine peptidase [Gemmataceae bacterium]